MEYTFRNSISDAPTTILLNEYNLTIKRGKAEQVIPYAGIVEVQLRKGPNKQFKTYLHPDGHPRLTVSNKYYGDEKIAEDRSRGYSTFIRVLHFHLKDKSKATYASGTRLPGLWLWMSLLVAFSFTISFVADYMGIRLMNPLIQGAILSVVGILIVLLPMLRQWPRSYRPTDIPMEFLP